MPKTPNGFYRVSLNADEITVLKNHYDNAMTELEDAHSQATQPVIKSALAKQMETIEQRTKAVNEMMQPAPRVGRPKGSKSKNKANPTPELPGVAPATTTA